MEKSIGLIRKAKESIYFKVPGMKRKRLGVIVGGDHEQGWQVLGCRQSHKAKADLFHLATDCLWSFEQHKAERRPSGRHEAVSSKGRQLTAAVVNRRAQVGAERFSIAEEDIVRHPVVVHRMRNTLARLARSNGIGARYAVTSCGLLDNEDFDAMELYSEYLLALLQAFRRETSQAPEADLAEFKAYLNEPTTGNRIASVLHRDGKTAGIRYLQSRTNNLNKIAEVEVTGLAAPLHEGLDSWRRDKANIAWALRRLRIENRMAAKIVMLKFALGKEKVGQTNRSIASSLERLTGQRWTGGKVAYVLAEGLCSLRRYLC